VAAKELQRQLGCTYKTAWRMAHELRKHMANSDSREPLSGHVEIDETYVGGRQKAQPGKRGRGTPGKTIVFGMVERDGRLLAGPVERINMRTLEPLILKHVEKGSTVSTDELASYNDLRLSYDHGRVRHPANQYKKGIHYTNTVEGVWSILKRSIRGTHVHVSSKHMWKYVSEFAYRYNMRKEPWAMFDRLVSSLSLPRLADA
jgi:transposase-like protein